MGPKVEFSMLPFIIFNSTQVSEHGNIFELRKRYGSPRSRTRKSEQEMSILFLGPNL